MSFPRPKNKSKNHGHLAVQREFDISVLVVSSPVSLIAGVAVGSQASRLPWLVKSLEVKHIEAPVESSTNSVLEKLRGIGSACDCGSIVSTAYDSISNGVSLVGGGFDTVSWPSSLSVPDFDLGG